MSTADEPAIVGVFQNHSDAQQAVKDLQRAGYTAEDIGYVGRGDVAPDGVRDAGDESAEEAGAEAAGGAVRGGIFGGVLGALVVLIPGFGPVLGGGLLISAIGGTAVGAAAGGLIGALTTLGVSDDDARNYDKELRAGRTLVTVRPGGRPDEVRSILRRNAASDISRRRAA